MIVRIPQQIALRNTAAQSTRVCEVIELPRVVVKER